MTRSPVDPDIIGTRPVRDETEDAPLWAQRSASPEVSRAELPGAGQRARREARERAHAKLDATYGRIVLVLSAWPGGLTRSEIADQTGIVVNTVNARVSELRALPEDDERRVITHGRRNGESVVLLARLRPPLTEER